MELKKELLDNGKKEIWSSGLIILKKPLLVTIFMRTLKKGIFTILS